MFYVAERVHRYFRANSARAVCRKPIAIQADSPLISFTFDDFPRSAWLTGGDILKSLGVAGTYYAALGLMGEDSPSGQIFLQEDLAKILDDGHELGSHTYSHCDSWNTVPRVFEQSVLENQKALASLMGGTKFKTFSYPFCAPRPATKKRIARHFLCCRGLQATSNSGIADLNQLSAFFLERAEDGMRTIKDLIDKNKQERGWIIFATHDVDSRPSRYGCSPEFFGDAVAYAVQSGARVLPVVKALEAIQQAGASDA